MSTARTSFSCPTSTKVLFFSGATRSARTKLTSADTQMMSPT
jgi:hypothetical protein